MSKAEVDKPYRWEVLFQRQMKILAKLNAIEDQLRVAGFSPEFVRDVGDEQIYLAFRGDTANRVIQKLTQ